MKELLNKLERDGKVRIVEPSEEICKSYGGKSVSNMISAKILLENNRLEESVSLIYYSMYNLVLALLFKIGVKSEVHLASIFLLKEVFGLDNNDIIEAKKERIDKQYYTGFKIEKKEVVKGIETAEDFNRNLNGFILGLNNQKIEEFRNKMEELLR